MAEVQKQNEGQRSNEELDRMAFQMYSERMATAGPKNAEQEALKSYRDADQFLAVRNKIRTGDLKPKAPEGPQLADCCCPNQARTHPINLVAKLWTDRKSGLSVPGDLAKVQRIHKWLQDNPTPEQNAEELPHRLSREFRDLDWNLDTIQVARSIFPAYCK